MLGGRWITAVWLIKVMEGVGLGLARAGCIYGLRYKKGGTSGGEMGGRRDGHEGFNLRNV